MIFREARLNIYRVSATKKLLKNAENGGKHVRKTSRKRSLKTDAKNIEKLSPKGLQNGSKMDPKWSQNCHKIVKVGQDGPKSPKMVQN